VSASAFENPSYEEGTLRLLRCLQANEVPEIVLERLALIFEKPVKLLCWVGDVEPAIGTTRVTPGFYASDLFVELLEAVRALDWEVVAVVLEQASPPNPAETPTAQTVHAKTGGAAW
jgi:hypothetical protein